MKEACQGCRFWKNQNIEPEADFPGLCRRNPPVVADDKRWPSVWPNEWCGEWQPVPDPEEGVSESDPLL